MLQKILLAGAAFTFLIGAAQAADVEPLPEAYDWTGGYIGLQAGYAWDHGNVDLDVYPGFIFTPPLYADSLSRDGFIGGLHAGYLHQSDNLVFGIEGDIEYADIHGSSGIRAVEPVTLSDLDYDIDWLGSLRLRGGFAFDRVLVYLTGGVAVGGASLDSDIDEAVFIGPLDGSEDETKWGWTIGGGIDYAIWDDVSIRVEYRYTDLGKSKVGNGLPALGNDNILETEVKNDFHAVRGGVSWRF